MCETACQPSSAPTLLPVHTYLRLSVGHELGILGHSWSPRHSRCLSKLPGTNVVELCLGVQLMLAMSEEACRTTSTAIVLPVIADLCFFSTSFSRHRSPWPHSSWRWVWQEAWPNTTGCSWGWYTARACSSCAQERTGPTAPSSSTSGRWCWRRCPHAILGSRLSTKLN